MKATDIQIGGSHYKKYPVDPMRIATMLSLTPAIMSAFKYAVRFKDKGKPEEDLRKCIHCLELSLELDFYNPLPMTASQAKYHKQQHKERLGHIFKAMPDLHKFNKAFSGNHKQLLELIYLTKTWWQPVYARFAIECAEKLIKSMENSDV